MTIITYLEVCWTDSQLSWNSSQYDDMGAVLLDKSFIWTPEILVLVGYKESITLEYLDNSIVTSNGNVTVRSLSYTTFRCSVDFQRYPFDSQTCSFGFYYLPPTLTDVLPVTLLEDIIQSEFVKRDPYVYPGEWVQEGTSWNYSKDANHQSYPTYFVKVKRQPAYYVITILFPMTLTSLMIPLVFVIPVESGEKISYLVTIYTSTAIFLTYISDVMPRSLSSVPYLAILLSEVMCEGFVVILATLCVVKKYKGDNRNNKSKPGAKIFPENASQESTAEKKMSEQFQKESCQKFLFLKPILYNAESCSDFFSKRCVYGFCSYGCCEKPLSGPAFVAAIVVPIFGVCFIVIVICMCCHFRRISKRIMGTANYVEQRTYFGPGLGRTQMTYFAAGGPTTGAVAGYPVQPHGECPPQYPAKPAPQYPACAPSEFPTPQYPAHPAPQYPANPAPQYPPCPPSECPPPQYPANPAPQYPPCPPYQHQEQPKLNQ
ncbi:hypothetical protein Btru_038797 [Bulinus truncatus]|nr:hypothetical protein Btru_038797 [Bulinus truncatus]